MEFLSVGFLSLLFLLVSVLIFYIKDDVYVMKECVNDLLYNNDLVFLMFMLENDDISMDISFYFIGVDMRDLKSF